MEDHPSGYPRFSALIGTHSSFYACRRFSTLRARLLLQKQDRLAKLEHQLQRIDEEELQPLFLGSLRRDRNQGRERVLADIDVALQDYDKYLERLDHIFSLKAARPRDVTNLCNWLEYTGCVARDETEFLTTGKDLISPIRAEDSALTPFQELIEDLAINIRPLRRLLRFSNESRDSDIHILSAATIEPFARFVAAGLVITLLLVPIVVVNSLTSMTAKTIAIIISCAVFVLCLPGLTSANIKETVLAGTTYATVMVVFIAGNGVVSN